MGLAATRNTTDWLDVKQYPFEPKRLSVEGGRVHYIDEGSGPVVAFVHGAQTWSFLYRHLIRDLSKDHRCIAIDHLGFGLSDKPSAFAGTPGQHARNLGRLLDYLAVDKLTLVGHDCGGPISVSYAQAHPNKVERIVLMNTWLWGLKGDADLEKGAKLASGGIGSFLFTRMNWSTKHIKPLFHDKQRFTPEIHDAYFGPFSAKEHRLGPLKLEQALLAEHDWYDDLWANRGMIEDAPKLFLWGAHDARFGEKYLNRLWSGFPLAEVHKFDDCGHFPPEEKPHECASHIRKFLA